jgi:hypothetical protein
VNTANDKRGASSITAGAGGGGSGGIELLN